MGQENGGEQQGTEILYSFLKQQAMHPIDNVNARREFDTRCHSVVSTSGVVKPLKPVLRWRKRHCVVNE